MHFLDLFWGAQKHHKIDPNSLRFFWHVTRCVSMFYSKSVKTELQDSVKCAQNFEVPRKDVFSVRHEPNRKNNILGTHEKSWLIQCFARKCLNMGCLMSPHVFCWEGFSSWLKWSLYFFGTKFGLHDCFLVIPGEYGLPVLVRIAEFIF